MEELIELASALGETWSEEQALIAMDQMDGDGSGSLDLEELRVWYTDFERGGGGMLGEALRKEGDLRFRRFARALLQVRQDGEMSVEVDAALKAVQEARSDPRLRARLPLSPLTLLLAFYSACRSAGPPVLSSSDCSVRADAAGMASRPQRSRV